MGDMEIDAYKIRMQAQLLNQLESLQFLRNHLIKITLFSDNSYQQYGDHQAVQYDIHPGKNTQGLSCSQQIVDAVKKTIEDEQKAITEKIYNLQNNVKTELVRTE